MINTKNKKMLTMIPIVAALWQHVNSKEPLHLAIDDTQNLKELEFGKVITLVGVHL